MGFLSIQTSVALLLVLTGIYETNASGLVAYGGVTPDEDPVNVVYRSSLETHRISREWRKGLQEAEAWLRYSQRNGKSPATVKTARDACIYFLKIYANAVYDEVRFSLTDKRAIYNNVIRLLNILEDCSEKDAAIALIRELIGLDTTYVLEDKIRLVGTMTEAQATKALVDDAYLFTPDDTENSAVTDLRIRYISALMAKVGRA